MGLDKEKIIEICSDNLLNFERVINGMSYESKGIINSEMLLFVSLVKYFNIKLIIESGRANGQSTKIIAKYFNNPEYRIISTEYTKYDPEVKNSYKKLKNYKNLTLLFGDSFNLIPNLITEECCILIDGPKGLNALKLALDCFKNPFIKAVLIHDLYKDSPYREIAEKMFPNHFFTDDKDYVKSFRRIDKKNWIEIRKYRDFRSWGPYRRGTKNFKSYSSTLMAAFNYLDSIDISQFISHSHSNKHLKSKWRIKNLIVGWRKRIKKLINFPFSYIFYEKTINHRKVLDLKHLIKCWFELAYNEFKIMFSK